MNALASPVVRRAMLIALAGALALYVAITLTGLGGARLAVLGDRAGRPGRAAVPVARRCGLARVLPDELRRGAPARPARPPAPRRHRPRRRDRRARGSRARDRRPVRAGHRRLAGGGA